MLTVLLKEINTYLSSLIAYIAMTVFLLATGLFIWVFPEYSVLEFGYANLDPLFAMSPWIFLFLIPALTMRTFAEEKRAGTIEWLLTKPLSDWQIILAKFFASLSLVAICLLPTLLYYITLWQLADPVGNLDHASILGSYLGLFFLAASFCAIGIFASSLSSNQIIAFILAVFLCFVFYVAFASLSKMGFSNNLTSFLDQLSIDTHYLSLSKGVIDTRDVVYFVSHVFLFLSLTKYSLESRKW